MKTVRILEVEFANCHQAKFNFFDIVGCHTKAGCQNLMYNLLSQNLSKQNLYYGKHEEHPG